MSFQDQENEQEQTADQLKFNVGEREFDAESAAKKIISADEHIAKIQEENAKIREELERAKTDKAASDKLEEALAKISANKSESSQGDTPSVSEDKVRELTTNQIEAYLADKAAVEQKQAAETLATVTFKETGEKLKAKYGEDVDKAVVAYAAKLGVAPDYVYNMARDPSSAKVLLASMDVTAPASQASPQSSFRLQANQTDGLNTTDIDFSKASSRDLAKLLMAAN